MIYLKFQIVKLYRKTEKELILRWGDLICEENPDIMLGYNVFGFDWKFILDRCRELGCKTQFLEKISKNTETSNDKKDDNNIS